ncbi:MAG: rRNA pseudouridine synthase [Deltaproteobacteria bacterium]|nr:MAG: rRNA pseudouridine synthase [Deltaproteobacteria bacterium]
MADCGITSRRKAEDLITQGRVTVNTMVADVLGTKVDPAKDVVEVDGQLLDLNSVSKVYLVMNKPRGFVTTVSDPEGRHTVMELIKEVSERVYPVGRLDYLSEGLLLLTNDGELANRIMHPSNQITKVYEVKVFGLVTPKILRKLREGVTVDGDFLKPLSVRPIKQLEHKTWLEFTLGDGKNREIRKICESCGLTVDKLKRVAIGNLNIKGIAPGNYTYLTKGQLEKKLSKDYQTTRASIIIKAKKFGERKLANDESYAKYRKATYLDVMKSYKEKAQLS